MLELVEDLLGIILVLVAVSTIPPLARWLWGFDPYERFIRWLTRR